MAKVLTDKRGTFGIPTGSTTVDVTEGLLATISADVVALAGTSSWSYFPTLVEIEDGEVKRGGSGSGEDTILLCTQGVLVKLEATDVSSGDIADFVPGYVVIPAANGQYNASAYPELSGTHRMIGAVVANDGTCATVYIDPGVPMVRVLE